LYLRYFLPIVFAVLAFGLTSSLQEAYAGNNNVPPPPVDCDTSTFSPRTFTLFDENSELFIDPCDFNSFSWFVPSEGTRTDHIDGQELFICKIVAGACVEVLSVDDFIVTAAFTTAEGTTLDVFYKNDSIDVAIRITWKLLGGLFGSSESTLNETIEIKRTGEGTTTYRFFQETDFNLAGASPDTSVQISPTYGRQEDSTPEFGPPNSFQVILIATSIESFL